ncbi:MAG TPA: hypothetical protein VIE44_03400 [Methylomirabilota bacterium]|jgi:hypothetical protein
MRLILALTLAAAAILGPAARTSPAGGRADGLTGMWAGRWTADDGARGGAVEMILSQEPDHPTVVAQMTFVDGSVSDTARYEGRLTRQGVYLQLAGGGTLVLALDSERRLTGEFAGGPHVPARLGLLELTRRG